MEKSKVRLIAGISSTDIEDIFVEDEGRKNQPTAACEVSSAALSSMFL